ncbi:putative receptor-like protein kinase At4g00960 [Neltuma alba]|uniref:putative receptor-like protein kinase At4g00960 n=1 Tax=Neltuma alba TaxID=207710 RepID=UPI0010A43568|nr:putative receptor-like protein kinase At4g00960 [Prosopis alba]
MFPALMLSFGAEQVTAFQFIESDCYPLTDNKPNHTYEANVKALLSDLSSNSTQDNGFYNSLAGWGTTNPIRGQALCRGDVTPSTCQHCVSLAAQKTLTSSLNCTEFIIYYDLCMLRYNSKSFKFDDIVDDGLAWSGNKTEISDESRFNQTVWVLLRIVTAKAANSNFPDKKFATYEVPVTATQKLYGLAQCTPDLTVSDCGQCFQTALRQFQEFCVVQDESKGVEFCAEIPRVMVFLAGCNVRYDTHRFYNVSNVSNVPAAVRLATSGKRHAGSRIIVVIVASTIISPTLFCLSCYLLRRKLRKSRQTILTQNFGEESSKLKSLRFNLTTIEAATNKFSLQNRIGKGGFGYVYKGVLHDGQEIAVKRLSKNSLQGALEFKNEVLLIAKLQHRNLVTLLGFCLEKQEKILIYEYVPNKSIDFFLFDSKNQRQLNWLERFNIIGGIARGLLYLHEHSRFKVIHRDLKPSNVLLDSKMNPKISDFGMARMVAIDQDQENTNRIVGTYGYMSPEYLMYGQFSEKSDIFSFGVIILEIISSRRNARSYESHLLTHAWKQWKEGTPLHVLDSCLMESCSQSEVVRCVQIGLLCVQENPEDRPTMSQTVSYLSNPSVELPSPREPAFFMHSRQNSSENIATESLLNRSSVNPNRFSLNEMSQTELFAR